MTLTINPHITDAKAALRRFLDDVAADVKRDPTSAVASQADAGDMAFAALTTLAQVAIINRLLQGDTPERAKAFAWRSVEASLTKLARRESGTVETVTQGFHERWRDMAVGDIAQINGVPHSKVSDTEAQRIHSEADPTPTTPFTTLLEIV